MTATARLRFDSVHDLADFAGRDLGVTQWVTLDEERVERFHRAVGATARTSTEHTELVPPWLVLAAVSPTIKDLYEVAGVRMRINYGTESIRFERQIRRGDRVRATVALTGAAPAGAGYRFTMRLAFESQGCDEPAGHAEVVMIMAAGAAE